MEKQRDMKSYLEAEKAMRADEDMINQLMQYPPLSEIDDGKTSLDYDGINPNWGYPNLSERGMQCREAMIDAIKAMNEETKGVDYYDVDPKAIKGCFKGVMQEFADDFDEARLYQKRYPKSRIDALISYKTK